MSVTRLVFLVSLLLGGMAVDTTAQPGDLERLCEMPTKGKLKGVFSFRTTKFLSSKTITRIFVATWSVSDSDAMQDEVRRRLVILEKDGASYKEVFNFEQKNPIEFQEFQSFNSLAVPGFVVHFSSDVNGVGPVLVIAMVQDNFRIVFQGESSEIVDLDGNGIPEVFESIWPDGDGYPKSTTIYVWNGMKYQKLITSNWESRFSARVLKRIRRYETGRTKPKRSWAMYANKYLN